MKKLYLDYAATTPVYPKVIEAMGPYFLEKFGNPSSLHLLGEETKKIINKIRVYFAANIKALPEEIYFTSCASESNNIVIKSLNYAKRTKIAISNIEHPSVYDSAYSLTGKNQVNIIPVNSDGLLEAKKIEKNIDGKTGIVSVIHVNNITGVIQNLEQIGNICKTKDVLFHTDAAQSFGKIDIDVRKMNIDLLSASGHKLGAPKGIGLLYIKKGIKINPWIHGGGQERGLRSGTENVPGIVGFAKALDIQNKINKNKISEIRNTFIVELGKIGGHIISPQDGIYNLINVSFPGVDNTTLVTFLSQRGIYVSAGSACDSKKEKEDRVLKSMGLADEIIRGSIRISFSDNIKEKDISDIVSEIDEIVEKLKVN